MKSYTPDEKITFLLKIGILLHKYGTNAPRIEAALTGIMKALGSHGQVFSSPTYISISVDEGTNQVMRHVRVKPGAVDLKRLCEVDELADKVCAEEVSVPDAIKELSRIESEKSSYSNLLSVLAYGLTAASLVVIFQGGFLDILLSSIIGIVVGLLGILAQKKEAFEQVYEFVAAFICTMFAIVLNNFFPVVHVQTVVLSSLIVIIPGFTITIAMAELATKNLVSGTARFMGAIIDFFKISFGVMLAMQIGNLFLGDVQVMPSIPFGQAITYLAIIGACASFTIIFKARLSDMKWILLIGALIYTALKLFGIVLSSELSVFLASFLVGVCSNLFAKSFNRPSMILFLPGIIFLVPGSIGFKSVNLLLGTDYLQGIGVGIQVFVVTITIVSGLFLANVFVNPRRSL